MTVVFFVRDVFDKCYSALDRTVLFDFPNLFSEAQPPSSSKIDM